MAKGGDGYMVTLSFEMYIKISKLDVSFTMGISIM